MTGRALAILAFLPLAASALAQQPSGQEYYVRNDTDRTFSCGFLQPPDRKVHRFVLRRGTEHSRILPQGRPWALACDTRVRGQRYSLQPGVHYALSQQATGQIVLRRID